MLTATQQDFVQTLLDVISVAQTGYEAKLLENVLKNIHNPLAIWASTDDAITELYEYFDTRLLDKDANPTTVQKMRTACFEVFELQDKPTSINFSDGVDHLRDLAKKLSIDLR